MPQRSDEILRRLVGAGVEFVVAGGVAANLHGSAYVTRDLDIVASLTLENCRKLLESLGPFSPRFYQAADKPPVRHSAEELARFKDLYWLTDLGTIDILGSSPPIGDFAAVAAHAVEVTLLGLKVKVISLDDLIAVKHHVGRPKDLSVEVELKAIRDRLKGQK